MNASNFYNPVMEASTAAFSNRFVDRFTRPEKVHLENLDSSLLEFKGDTSVDMFKLDEEMLDEEPHPTDDLSFHTA